MCIRDRSADFVLAATDETLFNMSNPDVVCRWGSNATADGISTGWCDPAAILGNYTLVSAQVGRWSSVFGTGPAVAIINTLLSPHLVISNSLACHATSAHSALKVLVASNSRRVSFEPSSRSWFERASMGFYRIATILISFCVLSMVSSFKIWVYAVYMIPAVALGAQKLCRANGMPTLTPEHIAPWCSQPYFLLHTLLAAALAWGGIPGTVLSLLARCYPDAPDYPGYVYGLVLLCEGFLVVMARSARTITHFCQVGFWVFSLCCAYTLAYGGQGCWGVLVFGSYLVMLTMALHCTFSFEFPVYESLSATKPRQFQYTAVFGRSYGELPSFWEFYCDGPWHVHHDRMGGLHARRRAAAGSLGGWTCSYLFGLALCGLIYLVFVANVDNLSLIHI
eukprot:TRINITY_DN11629_c0_g1_i2.p1 TRINITY_DN11629_c0_g1~~TRINITY_DN11629_c0_g1_i2.p1  ORF type:complete len:395 (-),score=71.64 TRINITY_DN11629_c0_g1_i2:58-1242(-)